MNSPAAQPTLRDDWQERRAFLARTDHDNEFVDVQLRVLDFLLKRYGDSPEAGRPAQFPLPSALYINQRAVLVHHHLGKHLASGVKSPHQAQERMASILHRMAEPETAESAAHFFVADAAALEEQPAEAEIETSVVAPYVGEPHEVREARRLRFLLADLSHAVRMRVIFDLGERGNLDDAGLLMDLLALPESPDEGRGERQMLVGAIEKIAGTRPRGQEGYANDPLDLATSRNSLGLEPPRPRPADWTGLHGLLLGSSVTMGLAMVITVIAVLFTRGTSPGAIYGSAALVGVYALGVGIAWYLWERTRRRRGW